MLDKKIGSIFDSPISIWFERFKGWHRHVGSLFAAARDRTRFRLGLVARVLSIFCVPSLSRCGGIRRLLTYKNIKGKGVKRSERTNGRNERQKSPLEMIYVFVSSYNSSRKRGKAMNIILLHGIGGVSLS